MESEEISLKSLAKVGGVAALVVVFLLVSIFVWHAWTTKRASRTILHSGVTYVGPSPQGGAQAPLNLPAKFQAKNEETWRTVTGAIYPYNFQAPESLELVRFPEDQYDIYAVSYNNQPPQSHVLIGVDNLSKNPKLEEYISKPKIEYVRNWWKQFGALSGVASVTPFTNSQGMKGYKARFLLQGGNPTSYDDIFFETSKKKDVVIHLSNSILDDQVFDKIVDTVSWGSPSANTK